MADCAAHRYGHSPGVATPNTEIQASQGKANLPNTAAANISYYTPAQSPPAGTAIDPQSDGNSIPTLFQPFKLRSLTLQNRIVVSPMCQYSADDGHHTAWHFTHLGGIIQRGPGLTIIEATAVSPEGRITPQDSGLWKDSQIEPLRKIVEFAHGQGQKIGIQLAHAGRKASTVAPWVDRKGVATEEVGGWPSRVFSASSIPYDDNLYKPNAMTKDDIEGLKKDWVASVKRVLTAGFDAIEIHASHGYLLHSFLSPATNNRTDVYGGGFENRIRLLLELVDLTRRNIPDTMPLLVRIPGTDWLEYEPSSPSWDIEQAVELARALAATGAVDLLDVSSGGLLAAQRIQMGPGYQAPFSERVTAAVKGTGVAVGVVGTITSGKQAQELLERGVADVVFVGRMFQKNPALVWSWAEELGTEVRVANQIGWGFGARAGRGPKKHP